MAKNLARSLLALILAVSAMQARAADRIPLYTYYPDPPFAANSETSFTDKLAAWLSQRAAGKYVFVPTQIPRRRLEMLVKQPHWTGVVAWANPLWFGKDSEQLQSWTRPYMLDANLVISLRSRPVEFTNDQSLAGLRLGTVLGYSYPDLDIALRAGTLTKEDSLGEFSNLLKLKGRRVDVAFLQASSLPYFRAKFPDFDDWSYIAPKPRTTFVRHLFIGREQPELLKFLDEQMAVLAADKSWRELFGSCELLAGQLSSMKGVPTGLCRRE